MEFLQKCGEMGGRMSIVTLGRKMKIGDKGLVAVRKMLLRLEK